MTQDTPQTQENQEKPNDKEYNFRALEAKFKKELEQERQARADLEKRLQENHRKPPEEDEDDDYDDPYVDKKKLTKTLNKFGEQTIQQTRSEVQKAVDNALQRERQQNWLKQNGDFYDVMQHADKIPELDPELAETVLNMPDSFERQKLVYKNIKALGLHEPKKKESSIQEKIDQNRRSPYYQPSGSSAAPYTPQGDYSPAGQKQAYEKLQQLKKNLRLG